MTPLSRFCVTFWIMPAQAGCVVSNKVMQSLSVMELSIIKQKPKLNVH